MEENASKLPGDSLLGKAVLTEEVTHYFFFFFLRSFCSPLG